MVVEGGFHFLKNTVIFDPIDRILIFGRFSTFCPLRDCFICHILSMGLENNLFCFRHSRDSIYSRMAIYVYMYICMYTCQHISIRTYMLALRGATISWYWGLCIYHKATAFGTVSAAEGLTRTLGLFGCEVPAWVSTFHYYSMCFRLGYGCSVVS